MKTTVRLLLVFALFSSCARVLVRLEPIFREVQGFRSRYFEDYDYDNGDYENRIQEEESFPWLQIREQLPQQSLLQTLAFLRPQLIAITTKRSRQ
ncbi:hypothetical protein V3C99_002266 [Haemonchus contortus]